MKTLNRPTAKKKLVTKHETMRWVSRYASLSIRKTAGQYVVRLEDHETGKVTKTPFKTLPGALVAAEALKNYYL